MKNENQKETKYLNELIKNHYPELRDVKIELSSEWILNTSEGPELSPILFYSEAIGTFIDKDKYIIFYDPSEWTEKEEEKEKNIYRGFLSHELSHIVQEENKKKLRGIKKILVPLTNLFYKEIRIDKDVIKRNLGKELLILKKFKMKETGKIYHGYNSKN